jgi:hypothetical protein
MNQCDFFKNTKLQTSLQYEMSRLGLEYKTQLKLLYSLDKLSFYQVTLKVSYQKKLNEFVESTGYLLENTESENCFGLL